MSALEGLAMGLLGGVQGAGQAYADISDDNIKRRRALDDEARKREQMVADEVRKTQLAKDLEVWKRDLIRQEKERDVAAKAERRGKLMDDQMWSRAATSDQGTSLSNDELNDVAMKLYQEGHDDEAKSLLDLVKTKASIDKTDEGGWSATARGIYHTKTGEFKQTDDGRRVVTNNGTGGSGGSGGSEKVADMTKFFKKNTTVLKSGKASNEEVFDQERYSKYSNWLNANGKVENRSSYTEWVGLNEPSGKAKSSNTSGGGNGKLRYVPGKGLVKMN